MIPLPSVSNRHPPPPLPSSTTGASSLTPPHIVRVSDARELVAWLQSLGVPEVAEAEAFETIVSVGLRRAYEKIVRLVSIKGGFDEGYLEAEKSETGQLVGLLLIIALFTTVSAAQSLV